MEDTDCYSPSASLKDPRPEQEHLHVILFYKYVVLDDIPSVIGSQQTICTKLELTGRLRVAPEGINGTLCGSLSSLEQYESFMEQSLWFGGIQYKYSRVDEVDPFEENKLYVRECVEITSTGPMKECKPFALGGTAGKHLPPAEFHKLLKRAQSDEDVIVIDTRNWYETSVGSFQGAIDPKIRNFAQFPIWVQNNKEKLANKHVAMFCTGGIRCEKASAYVKSLNLTSEVSQLEGGIHSYLEAFGPDSEGIRTRRHLKPTVTLGIDDDEECLYKGINFQFDKRYSSLVAGHGNTHEASNCVNCGGPWSETREGVQCVVCKDFVLMCECCLKGFMLTTLEFSSQKQDEGKRLIRCCEHQLLSDDWKEFVMKLDVENMKNQVQALRYLLEKCSEKDSKYPRKKRRQQALRLQLERLLEGLKERGVTAVEKGESYDGFVPFVPLLNSLRANLGG